MSMLKFKIRIEYTDGLRPSTQGAVRALDRDAALSMVTADLAHPHSIFCEEVPIVQACLFSDDWEERVVKPHKDAYVPRHVVPNLKRPLILGLCNAIYTCRWAVKRDGTGWQSARKAGVWEVLRDLWNATALTWDEFQWLEALQTACGELADENPMGITPFVDGPGAGILIARVDDVLDHAESNEAARISGRQSTVRSDGRENH